MYTILSFSPVDNRVRRGLRDHPERQEILDTKYGIHLTVFLSNLLFLSSWINGRTKRNIAQILNRESWCVSPNMSICVFHRAAEVSGAHKEPLAKREKM